MSTQSNDATDRLEKSTLAALPAEALAPTYLDDDLRIGIVHFGVGNFHRAHQAMYVDRLLRAGDAREWAICGIGLLERDAERTVRFGTNQVNDRFRLR